jgi:hypothetical protein
LWYLIIRKYTASEIEELSGIIGGTPQEGQFNLVCEALARSQFTPSIMNMFDDMDLSAPNVVEYFRNVKSVNALKWLLNHIGKGMSLQDLAQYLPVGSWGRLMLAYHDAERLDFVKVMQEHFGEASKCPLLAPIRRYIFVLCETLLGFEQSRPPPARSGGHRS